MDPFVIKLLGFAAATCTIVAYAPQFIKVWKTHSARDISLGMFLVMVLGLALWLVWPALRRCPPGRRQRRHHGARRRHLVHEAEVRVKLSSPLPACGQGNRIWRE